MLARQLERILSKFSLIIKKNASLEGEAFLKYLGYNSFGNHDAASKRADAASQSTTFHHALR